MHTFYLHDSFVSVDEKLDSLQEKIQILEGMNNTKFDEIMSELKRIHEIKTLEVSSFEKCNF